MGARGVTAAVRAGPRRAGMWPGLAAVLLLALVPPAAAQRLVAVRPVLEGDTLACLLVTDGLPGPRLEASLGSGLAAAIRLDLVLEREDGGVLARRGVTLRLVPDLWGGTVEVRWDEHRRLLADLDSLRAWLRAPPPFPVADPSRLDRIDPEARLRLRAAIALQPLAPAERSRLAAAVSGSDPAGERRETTIGVDRLIRLFFRGRDAPSPLAARSAPFRLPELAPAGLSREERR